MDSTTSPAFCSRCKGVLPFNQEKHDKRRCGRCGTLYRWVDPTAELSRRSWRYLLYAGAAAALVAGLEVLATAVGLGHPDVLALPLFPSIALAAVASGCLWRSVALRLRAGTFERLEPFELARMDQKLCEGMIRSDVVDSLFAAGWRPGMIRSALAGLRESR